MALVVLGAALIPKEPLKWYAPPARLELRCGVAATPYAARDFVRAPMLLTIDDGQAFEWVTCGDPHFARVTGIFTGWAVQLEVRLAAVR